MSLGKGCFTTFLVNSSTDDLYAHYLRLSQTAASIDLYFVISFKDFQFMLHQYITANDFNHHHIIKVIFDGQISFEERFNINFTKAVHNITLKTLQKPEKWQNLKLYPNKLQQELIKSVQNYGYDDYLLLDEQQVLETSIANIGIIKDLKIYTPALNQFILDGTIRQKIISNYAVEVTELTVDDLLSADAVFICNAIQIISMVCQIDQIELHPTQEAYQFLKQMKEQLGVSYEK